MSTSPGSGVHPFGVQCSGCGRTQPPDRQPVVQRWPYCVFCSAPLSMTRWVAAPPRGLGPAPRVVRVDAPYAGPPRYGRAHPAWGFPPVARVPGAPFPAAPAGRSTGSPKDRSTSGHGMGSPAGDSTDASAPPLSEKALRFRLSAAISLTLALTLVLAASAAAESWRFSLLLRGRTVVLPPGPVRASDIAVAASATAALLILVLALAATVVSLSGLYRAAADHAGLVPARNGRDIAVRLWVPGWNLYGAGQILIEVVSLVFRPVDGIGRPAPRWLARMVRWGWAAWVLNGLGAAAILVAAIVSRFSKWAAASDQFAANLVEAHIALNVLAAMVAAMVAVILAALRNEWFGDRFGRKQTWIVAPPVSLRAPAQVGSHRAPNQVGSHRAPTPVGSLSMQQGSAESVAADPAETVAGRDSSPALRSHAQWEANSRGIVPAQTSADSGADAGEHGRRQ